MLRNTSSALALLSFAGFVSCSGMENASDAEASGGSQTDGSERSSGGAGGTGNGTGGMQPAGGALSEPTSGGTSASGGETAATGGDASAGGVANAGAGGTGGGGGTGGDAIGSGGMPSGAGGALVEGSIRVDDVAPGFASIGEGTTGGGTDLSSAITVTTMAELQAQASGSEPALILVTPGDYMGALSPGANKTIIGIEPGVTIRGHIKISGEETSNIILRNLAVQGEYCASYDECRAGDDAVYIGNGAHHIWLDHMDISDGQDGNCDVTKAGDYVTVSWSHFHYTYDKEHRFSNLIAGSDDETESVGKLRITYMNCHFGERVDSRQPRGRFGNVHMLNNFHNTGGGQIHGVGKDMALIAESCVYEENRSIWTDMGSPRGWKGVDNIGSGSDLNDSRGSVFEIPYDYVPLQATEVALAVTATQCGAGNRCFLDY